MSRLFVQNLPAYIIENRLREHFSPYGEVTDAFIVKTKDGKSRRFGFVGYREENQAKKALDFLNNTFMDTCKLSIKFAQMRDSAEIERPWSKYSKGSSRYNQLNEKKQEHEENKIPKQISKKEHTSQQDSQLKEFIETMQPRSKTKFWANDDGLNPNATKEVQSGFHPQLPSDETDGDSNDDEDMMPLDDIPDKSVVTAKSNVSDLEYLRSKISKENVDEPLDSLDSEDEQASKKDEQASKESKEETALSSRLFIRNLAYTVVEEEMTELFSKFGQVVEVHLPLDETKRKKGFGFVSFAETEDAITAQTSLDNTAFQGRLLHVMHAMAPKGVAEEGGNKKLTSYKQKKEEQRRKQGNNTEGWNASHIRGDATVDSLSNRFGLQKGDILDKESDNMAVRLAVGETLLLKENKDFFEAEGVDLDALESAKASGSKRVERSTNVILVKNLPFSSEEKELYDLFSKFGDIGRLLFPPSKTLALIEFVEPSEARKAFRSLAYRKYQHVPLYLEWAPLRVLSKRPVADRKSELQQETSTPVSVVPELEMEDSTDHGNTLFVKNLNFSTEVNALQQIFEKVGKVRKATIAKKKDPKSKTGGMLSMGFGFVEFESSQCTQMALKSMQGVKLDGHALQIKVSSKQLVNNSKKIEKKKNNKTKIIVRNVAFEATASELRQLFSSFGQLKKLRLPKKFDGSHRGFAFVEFLTEQEAQNAFNSLAKSHLYGRHLVLEWAEDADDIDSLRVKASHDLAAIQDGERQKKKRKETKDPLSF